MAENRNLAYDLSLFEPSVKEQQKKNRNNVIKISEEQLERSRRPKYRPTTVISVLFVAMLIVSVLGTMIYSQVQLNELTTKINSMTKQLDESESVYTQLEMKAESKLSLKKVEDYAMNTLNMKKVEPQQIEYISLSKGDKAVIPQGANDRSLLDRISDAISDLLS